MFQFVANVIDPVIFRTLVQVSDKTVRIIGVNISLFNPCVVRMIGVNNSLINPCVGQDSLNCHTCA